MAKFLFLASFTTEGKRGLLKDGGTKRAKTIGKLVSDAGGTLESMHFALGEADVVMIADVPDVKTAAALSLNASASGAVEVRTIALLTPAEFDEACSTQVVYVPPGA